MDTLHTLPDLEEFLKNLPGATDEAVAKAMQVARQQIDESYDAAYEGLKDADPLDDTPFAGCTCGGSAHFHLVKLFGTAEAQEATRAKITSLVVQSMVESLLMALVQMSAGPNGPQMFGATPISPGFSRN